MRSKLPRNDSEKRFFQVEALCNYHNPRVNKHLTGICSYDFSGFMERPEDKPQTKEIKQYSLDLKSLNAIVNGSSRTQKSEKPQQKVFYHPPTVDEIYSEYEDKIMGFISSDH